jgi:hypothetical protein
MKIYKKKSHPIKDILSAFMIIFLIHSCKGQNSSDQSKSDWVINKLAGKVKKIKEITYAGDGLSKMINSTSEINYNEKGYTSQTRFEESFETPQITSISYNGNNTLKEIKLSDPANNEIMKVTYSYSKDGKEVDTKVENKSMNIIYSEKVINTYNNANQLVSTKTLQDEKLRSTVSIKDSAGQKITEEKLLDSTGKLKSKTIKKFDKKDNLLEKYQYTGPDAADLEFRIIFKYNERNHPIEVTKYNNDGSIEYKDSSKYVYDKTGNWIKRTDFSDNQIDTVTERKVEYY